MQSSNQPDFMSYISYVNDEGFIDKKNEEKAIQALKAKHLKLCNQSNRDTILHVAVRSGLVGLTKTLLEQDVDPYKMNNDKDSALSLAIKENNVEIIELILSKAEIPIDIGRDILLLVKNNNLELLKQIFSLADKEVIAAAMRSWKFIENNTALHYVIETIEEDDSKIEMLELLMAYGADPESKNEDDESPIDIAKKSGNEKIVAMLEREYFVEIEAQSSAATTTGKDKSRRILSDQQLDIAFKSLTFLLSLQIHPNLKNLDTLKKRALEIFHQLNSKDIALIFNLISKLECRNSKELTSFFQVLAKRAIEVADKFNQQGIGLVYNLIAKLDNVNGPEWQPLLQALAKRARGIAEAFDSQEIAMVCNLISKLDNVNGPEWQPLLQALAKRASAIAEKFNSQAIAMVFSCIAKLDNANSAEWQLLLQALAKRAVDIMDEFAHCGIGLLHHLLDKLNNPKNGVWQDLQQALAKRADQIWKNFQVRISESNDKKSEMRGRLFSNYENFLNFTSLQIPNLAYKNIDALGAVVKHNDAYYFQQTEETMNCAKNFMNAFWATKGNIELVINMHATKCKTKFITQSTHPSCIAFILTEIQGKKICFVSLSGGLNESKTLDKLKEFITFDFPKNNGVEFAVMNNNIDDFNQMIRDLTNDRDAKRDCAELAYTKGLVKLFLEYGNKIKIQGVANCSFYPYQNDKKYGACEGSSDYLITPYVKDQTIKPLKENRIIKFIPCCSQCMQNKPAMLALMAVSQNHGAGLYPEKNAAQKRELSPIKNTLGNFTGVLPPKV